MVKDSKTIAIWILAILLVISLAYVGYSCYQNWRLKEQISAYNQGAMTGYTQAFSDLIQEVAKCQPVPITVGNQTVMNLIAVECIQAQEQQAQ